jgi:hypothetical protein
VFTNYSLVAYDVVVLCKSCAVRAVEDLLSANKKFMSPSRKLLIDGHA